MAVSLEDQIIRLERYQEELGPDPALSAAIMTLATIRRFENEVREAIKVGQAKRKALRDGDPAARAVLDTFPDAAVTVTERADGFSEVVHRPEGDEHG